MKNTHGPESTDGVQYEGPNMAWSQDTGDLDTRSSQRRGKRERLDRGRGWLHTEQQRRGRLLEASRSDEGGGGVEVAVAEDVGEGS